MFARFDASKSTKGASKLRRDLINAEIANLRDLLPLPPSTRQRLSQLQLMALVCVYVRKANYFQQAFKRHEMSMQQAPTPNIGFSKALSGFLMMMTQNGKLLYISDNAAEYLGHSMEDLLIHGDSVYDIIDKQDHQAIQNELGHEVASISNRTFSLMRSSESAGTIPTSATDSTSTTLVSKRDSRIFLCRMNVSRNARRQMRFGDQKVVLVRGHYLSFLPLCSRNEPVFLATCMPIAMPETRECIVQGATNVFTSIHSMDMKFIHIDRNGEFHMDYRKNELVGVSWYQLLHWDCTREAQVKHRLITQSDQDRSCILLVRLQRRAGDWLWVHCVLQVKENLENQSSSSGSGSGSGSGSNSQEPVIVCTNQVLSEHEALVMRTNTWLYHYYLVQSKLQYGLSAYETHTSGAGAGAGAGATTGPGGERMIQYQQQQQHQHQHPSPHHSYAHQQHHHHHHTTSTPFQDIVMHHQNPYVQNPVVEYYHHHQQQPSAPQHQQHQHQHQHQHQSQHQHHHHHQNHIHQQKLVDSEPVDYSLPAASNNDSTSSPANSVASLPISVPLYSKRKARRTVGLAPLNLEPLKIDEATINGAETNEDVLINSNAGNASSGAGTGMLLLPSAGATAVPLSSITLHYALARPRLAMKSVSSANNNGNNNNNNIDPIDVLEQWNPSPPWSDSTVQKVPDIVHQDLSPYTTSTPPTPSGTPGVPSHSTHMTFTFDWTPEQYVPNLTTLNSSGAGGGVGVGGDGGGGGGGGGGGSRTLPESAVNLNTAGTNATSTETNDDHYAHYHHHHCRHYAHAHTHVHTHTHYGYNQQSNADISWPPLPIRPRSSNIPSHMHSQQPSPSDPEQTKDTT